MVRPEDCDYFNMLTDGEEKGEHRVLDYAQLCKAISSFHYLTEEVCEFREKRRHRSHP